MARDISSSSSSKSTSPSVSQKDLLKFYQKKYEEHQRKEDKYKEKIDRHLKNLVADRHELEEEVLRRGEKIADLQKALVELQLSLFEEREKFLHAAAENEELKRKEEQLHENIRQLLAMTHQQDLRDRIIYILKDPKVDIGYRTDASSKSRYAHEEKVQTNAHETLKKELDKLKQQLDEVLEISKNKTDVVLEDCKRALEESKSKILQDDLQMKKLQKMLQEKTDKNSMVAGVSSSVKRSAPVRKSSSAERQSPRDIFCETLSPAAAVDNVFVERAAPLTQNVSAERQSSSTATRGIFSERLHSVKVTTNDSLERQRFVPVSESISAERQSSLTLPKEIFDERLTSAKAVKDAFVERQKSVSIGQSVSAEWQSLPSASKGTFPKTLVSSVAVAGKASVESRQRYVPSSKSISAERQSSLASTKEIFDERFHSAKAIKDAFVERPVSVGKSNSAEKPSFRTASKDIFHKPFSSVAVTENASIERRKYVPIGESISAETQSSLTTTKDSTSAERPTLTKAAKSISWEYQHPETAPDSVFKSVSHSTRSISEENETTSQSSPGAEVLSKLCSRLKDIHLSLILLMKVIYKVKNILNSMQATKLYHRIARIPKTPDNLPHVVEENAVVQLETSLRQCTRLTFDINNMYKSVCKDITLNKNKIENINELKSEMKYFESVVKEISMFAADNDLLTVGLRRSDFFQALRDSSVVIREENRSLHLEDFKTIVSNCETFSQTVSEAVDFVESVIEKYTVKRNFRDIADSLKGFSHLSSKTHSNILQEDSTSNETLEKTKTESLQDLKKLVGIYKRTLKDSESFGLATGKLSERISQAEKVLHEEELKKCDDNFDEMIMGPELEEPDTAPSDREDIVRKINKVLYKVEQMEQGRYSKDEEMCRKLAENINVLTEQFKELTQEFNVKSFQQQFSEYSRVTLSKLEELAKQCRNSVVAAEAQIAAHRSNEKNLSEKLKETEELLRESISECLSLKQKLKQTDEKHEMEKYTLISTLKEKLEHQTSQGVDEVIDELVSNFPQYETVKSKPFICMYCRHGPGHKYCEEKIKDLTAECRKFKTQLKLLKQETDQERLTLKNHREVAEAAMADLTRRNQSMKESLETLEKKNSSLLEQLKLEKNRLKNMERFRRLEIEGFQTDIKQLKAKIKDLEKQLLKAVLIFETNHKDIELLKTVHETAQRSEQATAILRRLKAKLYQLENDLKSL